MTPTPSQNTDAKKRKSANSDPGLATEKIRSDAESVGTLLAGAFSEIVAVLPGGPHGPKRLADRYDMTIGTASRFLRAIAETAPIEVLQDVPGPVPLRRFLKAVKRSGEASDSVNAASVAIDEFEALIRKMGGNRSALNSVLAQWQPKGRKQFVQRRRQAAFKALAELKGVSLALDVACFAFHPSADESMMDVLSFGAHLGIARSRPDVGFYIGSRRQTSKNLPAPGPPQFETLEGHPVAEDLSGARLTGFTKGASAPIDFSQSGEEVIHTLGPTEFGSDASVDLVLAEVVRGAARRRGVGYSSDPFHVFRMPAAPCKELCLDLLMHESVVPEGRAELLVYSTIPRGVAVAGDPERASDLEQIPETLEIHNAGLASLHLNEFPRYVDALEHSFEKLSWDPKQFLSWRLRVSCPPLGSQFCILLRGSAPS